MISDLAIRLGNRLGRAGRAVRMVRPLYSAWLNTVYGRRGMPWRINGEPLRIDPVVRHLIPQENERPLFDYLRASIRPGEVVFDIGAFLGVYAILEARWAGERGRVVAFEPSASSFSILTRHAAMNGLAPPRLDARHAAVGAAAGRRTLVAFDDEPYRNHLAFDGASGQTSVDVLTVDAVSRELGRPPDWIRMDVQGLEFEVLEGARETIEEARGRIKIVAETHPQQWVELGIDRAQAHERFAAAGLRARPIPRGETLFTQSGHVVLEPLT
jgi:FkbM family methyltransferase